MHELSASNHIGRLAMTRHPEGGWYAESYRSTGLIPDGVLPPPFEGPRSYATAIYFLLEADDFSALHRIASDETWHFYDGGALTVHIITPDGDYYNFSLGRNPDRGERFQATVPAGCWFGAESAGPYSLVGCTVAPGFDFRDFELAQRDRLAAGYPHHTPLITRLTRNPA